MKNQAIQKIDAELKAYKGDSYGNAMKDYVAGVLREFCGQNEEFAQAVEQGGSLIPCVIAHAMIDVFSLYGADNALADWICITATIVVAVFYCVYLGRLKRS